MVLKIKDSFGKKLRERRYEAGLTLRELSRKAKVSLTTLHRWEMGEFRPSFSTMPRLAKALNISVNDLLT